MLYRLLRPFLFLLPPEFAHKLTFTLLKLFFCTNLTRCVLKPLPEKPVALMGLNFKNCIGLAAGLDKNGDYIDILLALGFGFIEVGCVTPRPQAGNSKPRVFRIPNAYALINRMGFNNKGVDYLVDRLRQRKVTGIVGVNIGKNKETPNPRAIEDYISCLEKVYPYADFVTINFSSPNTPGLRELISEPFLMKFLQVLNQRRQELADQHQRKVPLLIKLTIDFTPSELHYIVSCAVQHGVDGIIASNTSVDHSDVAALPHGNESGGLSGKPIRDKSIALVKFLQDTLQGRLPVIGVGGIMSVDDAQLFFKAGASLVQIYTGFIYEGPTLLSDLVNAL